MCLFYLIWELLLFTGAAPFLFLFFTVFFLLPEIESHVNAQASERIGHRESGFPVVVCVKYERGSDIVFAVVPSDACTRNQVEIDVSYPLCPVSSALGGLVVDTCLFIGYGRKKRDVQQTVSGKHPVIAVAHAEVVVGVAQAVKFQGGAELLLHFFGQLCMVEGNVMLGIGESGQQGTAAFPLVGRLAIGCRIGKSLVVENPVGIQSFDVALKTVELCVYIALTQIELFIGRQLEIGKLPKLAY